MKADMPETGAIVPGYAGHEDVQARHMSDQQVRAWVGERLADLQGRIPMGGYQDRVDALLMRCEFTDQHLIRAIEDDRFAEPDAAAAVEEYDRKLVALANSSTSTSAGTLGTLLDGLEGAFDERAAGIAALLKR